MNKSLYQVKVTNGNYFDVSDRYDGNLYVFKANSDTNIPYNAATHIFGVEFVGEARDGRNGAIFNHLCRRWGWNNKKMDEAKAEFDKLSFKVVAMSLIETIVEDKEPEIVEPRVKKQIRNSPKKEEVA